MCLSILKNILQSYPFETKNKDFLAARKGFKIRTLVFFIKKRRYIRVFRFNLNLIKKIKMKPHLFIIILLLILIIGCNMSNKQNPPKLFQPDWDGLNHENFALELGEEIELESDKIKGVVLDFSEDEGGKWYGICFLNKKKLFGRQIPSGFSKDCIDLLDFTFLHQTIINSLKRNGKREIDINKIGKGSIDTAKGIDEIIRSYNYGIEQRNKEQTPCDENLMKLNPVNECYFEIEKILKYN